MTDANTRRRNFVQAAAGDSEDELLDALHAIADAAGYKIGNPCRGAFCVNYLASYIITNNRDRSKQ